MLLLSILLFSLLFDACGSIATHEQGFVLPEATIESTHKAFRQGTIDCEDLVSRYVARIKRYDQQTGLNAIILFNPKAKQRAEALDEEFAKTGKLRPLHCVPVILKDNFDTADMPTAGGSIVLKDSYPPDDAFMVRRLRQEGAIIIAKSNMAEWAFSPYHTISSTHGETKNPYDLQRVPAGSSGGTAAAIAANFGLVGMGTDTGNSIRGPSSHTDLVGMRSTIGATSRDGVIPLVLNRDIAGPMTRTVIDNARVFSVIAGYDPADPVTVKAKGKFPDDLVVRVKAGSLNGKRIGVLREIANTDTADPDIENLFDKAIEDLKDNGAQIVDPFVIPNLKSLTEATGFCSRFQYDINNYLASLGPSAPVKSLAEIVREKKYLPGSEEAMKWAMSTNKAPQDMSPPCVDVEGDPRRKALLDAVVAAMDKYKVDALVYPSWNNPPRKIGDLESPHGNNSPIIAPHSGQPAITVPMGFTSEDLPAGLQFLGRPFSEVLLYQLAYAYEQATHHRKPPALFP